MDNAASGALVLTAARPRGKVAWQFAGLESKQHSHEPSNRSTTLPLYEYRCKACGHRFEKIQTYSAPDQKECPVCHAEVERLISAPSIQFKGSGFYSTDYPSRASKSAAAEGKAADKSGDGGSAKVVEGGASDGGSKSGASLDKGGSSDSTSSSSDKGGPSSSPAPAAPSAKKD